MNSIKKLNELFFDDLLGHRTATYSERASSLAMLSELSRHSSRCRTAYTAFDGDHLRLAASMRTSVLASNRVPTHPDSILGYYEAVQVRQGSKVEILADDMAFMRTADELWVFSSLSLPACLRQLPEGVLVEIAFWLRGGSQRRIVQVYPTASAATLWRKVSLQWSYGLLERHLERERLDDIEQVIACSENRRRVVYVLHDPQDGKYADWLRLANYRSMCVPLVPSLAVDAVPSRLAILVQWARLMDLADEIVVYPPALDRPKSHSVSLLEQYWERTHVTKPLRKGDWRALSIPKLADPQAWALTRYEAGAQLAESRS